MLFRGLLLLCSMWMLACATAPKYQLPLDSRFQEDLDRQPILVPEKRKISEVWDRVYNHGVRQIYRIIDIPGKIEWLGEVVSGEDGKEAEDINSWGEVANSSWYTNRAGQPDWNIESLKQEIQGRKIPDLKGPWEVISGKVDGVSPGFVVLDRNKEVYFVKFDPPGNPELASGAEIVSSWMYYALGYNVPDYFVIEAPLSIFKLSEKATTKGKYGIKRPMTDKDLRKIIESVDTYGKPTVRMSVSRLIPGDALGPFEFSGLRKDDPNHHIVNENRRSLRGYHLFSAWLNNPDIRSQNTLDVYTGEPGQGYVKHYFLDFGTSLGSSGDRAKNQRTGYEYFLDYSVIGRNFFSFGVYAPYWLSNEVSPYESIGLFESTQFHPRLWRPDYANTAYEAITHRDAYWATVKMLALTDDMLKLIVGQGQYSNPAAVNYLIKTLKERRLKFANEWFRLITPLDNFQLKSLESKTLKLQFENLAETSGLFKTTNLKATSSQSEISIEKNAESLVMHFASDQSWPQQFSIEFQLQTEENGQTLSLGQGVRVGIYCHSNECHIAGIQRL